MRTFSVGAASSSGRTPQVPAGYVFLFSISIHATQTASPMWELYFCASSLLMRPAVSPQLPPQFVGAAQAAAQAAEFRKLSAECGFGSEFAGDLLANCGGDIAAATAALQRLAFGDAVEPPRPQRGGESTSPAPEQRSRPAEQHAQQDEPAGPCYWDLLPPDCRRDTHTVVQPPVPPAGAPEACRQNMIPLSPFPPCVSASPQTDGPGPHKPHGRRQGSGHVPGVRPVGAAVAGVGDRPEPPKDHLRGVQQSSLCPLLTGCNPTHTSPMTARPPQTCAAWGCCHAPGSPERQLGGSIQVGDRLG